MPSAILMLPAIQFYNELFLWAEKIYNIYSDGLLAAKFQSIQTMCTQTRPQKIFCVSLL